MCGEKCQVGSDRAFDPFGFHIGEFMLAAGQGRFLQWRNAHPCPPENHPRKDARHECARVAYLLFRLSLQPLDDDQR
jgi:hypothetical protein